MHRDCLSTHSILAMDGASAAATVLQLIQTGITVSNALYQYASSVRNADKSCKKLTDDIKLMITIAHAANDVFSKFPTTTVSEELSRYWLTSSSPAMKCKRLLEELHAKMPQGDAGRMSLRKRLRWPLVEAEIKDAIEAFEKYVQYLQLSLQVVHIEATAWTETRATHADEEIKHIEASIKHVSRDIRTGFQTVSSLVNTLTHIDGVAMGTKAVIQEFAHSEELQKIFDWMNAIDCTIKHENTRTLRKETTCEWLFEEERYLRWLSHESAFLWIHGKPGAGKSVLASAVIEEIFKTMSDKDTLFKIYCDFRTERSTSASEVLRSLFMQALREAKHDWRQEFKDLVDRKSKGIGPPENLEILTNLLIRALKLHERPIIVIDALDECKDYTKLIQALAELCDNASCRLFVTSRSLQEILSSFQGLPSISLEEMAHATKKDMRLHIETEVALYPKLMPFWDEIIESLLAKADGMFRWVQCQLDRLSICRATGDIRRVLDTLPSGLYGTYDRILLDIERREFDSRHVRNALLWLVAGSVKLNELVELVMIDPEEDSSECASEFLCHDDFLEACGSLVRVENSWQGQYVSLSHFSVKEYFSDGHLHATRLGHYHVSLMHVHSQLVLRCMHYVLSYKFPCPPAASQSSSPKRVTYAVESCLHQLRKVATTDLDDALVESLYTLRKQVHHNPAKYLHMDAQGLGCTGSYIAPDAGLYVLIIHGPSDSQLLTKYLQRNCEFSLADVAHGDSPLVHALQYNRLQLAAALLDFGLDIDKFGVPDSVPDALAMHPLDLAVTWRAETFMSFLLSRRCSISKDIIHTAVDSSYGVSEVPIITLLMKHGAHATILRAGRNNPLHTLLSVPYTNPHEDILNLTKTLVEAGCNPTAENDAGDTPLQLAIGAGPVYWDTATYLLDKGAAFTADVHFHTHNLARAADYSWHSSAIDAARVATTRRSTTLADVCQAHFLLRKYLGIPSAVVVRILELARYWACTSFSCESLSGPNTKEFVFLKPIREGQRVDVLRIEFSAQPTAYHSARIEVEVHARVGSSNRVTARSTVYFGGFPENFTAMKAWNNKDPEHRKILESLKPGDMIQIKSRSLKYLGIDIYYSTPFTDGSYD